MSTDQQLVQPLRLALNNFLRSHMHIELEKNLSHDQIQSGLALEELKRGNNKYVKQKLTFTQKNIIDDQLKKTQDQIIEEIFAFNEQIKIDDKLFGAIFALREKKELGGDEEGVVPRLEQSYKLFEF